MTLRLCGFPLKSVFKSIDGVKMLRKFNRYYVIDCKRKMTFFPIQCSTNKGQICKFHCGKIIGLRNIQYLQIPCQKIMSSSKTFNTLKHATIRHVPDMESRIAVSSKHVAPLLQNCSSVEEQMEVLYKTVGLTSEDVENRIKLCSETENVLRPYFPNCSVNIMGSSVNGSGFKGCDVDMTLLWNCCDEEELNNPDINPSIGDIRSGQVSIETLHRLPSRKQLAFICYVLENTPNFRSPAAVLARCPIIRFSHAKDNLNCDLAINNRLGLKSTQLLFIYGKFDKRVLLLQATLRYWAQRANLLGGPLKFKSYGLSLLLIYFLQTRNPPVIPTVEYLLANCDFLQNEANWDLYVNEDIKKLPPSQNTQSADDLLKDFFSFYLHFDYTQVIRPLTGSCVSRSFYINNDDPVVKQFEVSSICVEDPLNVAWNVTCGVIYRNCKFFLKQLNMVYKLYENTKNWCPSGSNWGIIHLMNQKNLQESFTACRSGISFNIILKPQTVDALSKELGICKTNTNLKDIWLQKSSQVVRNILENGFLFKCTPLKDSENEVISGIPKLKYNCMKHKEDENIIHLDTNVNHKITGDHLKPKFQEAIENLSVTLDTEAPHIQPCTSVEPKQSEINCKKLYLHMSCRTQNTWLSRSIYKKKYEQHLTSKDTLERERFISEKIFQHFYSKELPEVAFDCECQESEVNGVPSLLIRIKPVESEDFPPKLTDFFQEYMPRVVNSLI